MIHIDKFGAKVEALIEKIKNLKFDFKDEDRESYAKDAKDDAINNLEVLLETATEEAEARETSEELD